jgi:hypothetical protein
LRTNAETITTHFLTGPQFYFMKKDEILYSAAGKAVVPLKLNI